MTPEAKVKKVVVAQLKKLCAYYFYPVTGGYGQSGVPDLRAWSIVLNDEGTVV